MLRRRLIYVVPALATAVVAVVLLGPGQSRPVTAVRVLASGGELRSLRLSALERFEGQEAPLADIAVELTVIGESTPRWLGRTDETGAAEALIDPPLSPGDRVRLSHGEDVLAEGELTGSSDEARVERRSVVATVQGSDLTLRVAPERGVLVPPFVERVRLTLARGGAPLAAELKVSALSADVTEATVTTGPRGEGAFSMMPLAQPVMLSFEVRGEGIEADAQASLDVVSSGMYIEPELDDGRIRVTSPGPRDRAFLSFYDDRGRARGSIVTLAKDERGFFRGTSIEAMPVGTIAIVASGDANEKGPSTVAWPAPGHIGRATAPELTLALDGVPPRADAEQKRVSAVRTVTVLGLCAAAAFELALLLWTGRRERMRLDVFSKTFEEETRRGRKQNASDRVSYSDEIRSDEGEPGDGAAPGPQASVIVSHRVLLGTICVLVLLSFAAIAGLVLR